MGSAAIGGWIAHIAFWILVVRGYAGGDLSLRGCAIAIGLWIAGYFVLGRYIPFASYIALIDIGLVLMIFKGDLRIT